MSFRKVPIGAAFDVRNGATPSSGELRYWEGDIPWVGPADLGKLKSRFIERGERSITPEGYASCGTQMVPMGTIILSIRAPIGHMAIASQAMCFNQGCRGLVPRATVCTDFAYWALVAHKPHLEAAGQGTTFIELGRDTLRAERIPLPDLETQKSIADFLGREAARIDQLIEKKERLVELLSEKDKATVKLHVLGQLGRRERAASEAYWLPDLPYEWPLQRCAYIFRNLDYRRIPVNSEQRADLAKIYPYYGASGIIDHVDQYIFEGDNILVGEDGANLVMQSTPIAFKASGKYWVNNHAHILHPRFGVLDYWIHALNQVPFEVFVTGSAQPKLTSESLGNIRLPNPPEAEQQQIVDSLQDARQALIPLRKPIMRSIDRLQEFRSALITAAVTGQIDVNTWSRRGSTDRRLDQIEEAMRARPSLPTTPTRSAPR